MNTHCKGHCVCGKVSFSISLTKSLNSYTVRACDCDFCSQRKITYLSDPDGKLSIVTHSPMIVLTQGSEQAQFLACANCQSIIAVTHEFQSGMKGAVNASLLETQQRVFETQSVSPKRLNPNEKLQRWQSVWFPTSINVILE